MNLFSWLGELVRGLNSFFFKPSLPQTLAMMRIMAGFGVFYINLNWTPSLMEFVGPKGWIEHDTMEMIRTTTPFEGPSVLWDGSDREPNPSRGTSSYSLFYHVTNPTGIWTLHWIILVVNLMFALGLFTRFTAVATWIGTLSYIQRAQTSLFGMDTMSSILLFYMMLAPCARVWSLDRLIEIWRAKNQGLPVPMVEPSSEATFFQRMIQIHFSIIYFGAGTSKLMGASWWSGTALWACVANYSFAPMQYDFYIRGLEALVANRWVWELFMSGMTVFTLVLELGFPFAVWMPQMRLPFMIVAIFFHTGIGILMGLRIFSFLMCIFVFSFLTPEELMAVLRYFGNLLGFQGKGPGTPRVSEGKVAA
jgi:hypothetical protein